MRLFNFEIDKSVITKLLKNIKNVNEGVHGLQTFGENNDYPQTIEGIIANSVYANSVVDIFVKFIVGQGFEDEALNDVIVGRDFRGKNVTALSLLRQIAYSVGVFNGHYEHLNVGLNDKGEFVGKDVYLVPFKNCRFPKADDNGYSAKVLVYNNWTKEDKTQKYDKDKIRNYHTFSNDKKIIAAQIESPDKITDFNGQIFFSFLDNRYTYPLSPFDPAYLDMDTERQISLYRNRQIRNGFMPKSIISIEQSTDIIDSDGNVSKSGESLDQENVDTFKEWIGSDAISVSVNVVESLTNDEGKPIIPIDIKTIEGSVDADLFNNWETALQQNIRLSGWNVPKIFLDPDAQGLGVTTGEAIKQVTTYYNKFTEYVRTFISKDLKELFSNNENETLKNADFTIKPLNFEEVVEILETGGSANPEIAKAQAGLRGSVGGVTGLLSIQDGVSSGKTDYDSAVKMLTEIYGFDEQTAKEILGNPKVEAGVEELPDATEID